MYGFYGGYGRPGFGFGSFGYGRPGFGFGLPFLTGVVIGTALTPNYYPYRPFY